MEAEAWDWTQRGLQERPAEASEIVRDGRLIFRKENAAAINQLVRAWKTAESRESETRR